MKVRCTYWDDEGLDKDECMIGKIYKVDEDGDITDEVNDKIRVLDQEGFIRKFWEKEFELIEDKMIIKNRDFSVLKGLESVNKWGFKTKITSTGKYEIGITIDSENKDNKNWTCIPIEYNSLESIKDMILQQGFEIEFEDVKEINTFEEFREFLKKNNLYFEPRKDFDICKIENDVAYANIEIEEKYKVKLNILRGDKD